MHLLTIKSRFLMHFMHRVSVITGFQNDQLKMTQQVLRKMTDWHFEDDQPPPLNNCLSLTFIHNNPSPYLRDVINE